MTALVTANIGTVALITGITSVLTKLKQQTLESQNATPQSYQCSVVAVVPLASSYHRHNFFWEGGGARGANAPPIFLYLRIDFFAAGLNRGK